MPARSLAVPSLVVMLTAAVASGQEPQYTGFARPSPASSYRYEGAIDLDLDGVRDLVGWWYLANGRIKLHQTHRSPDTGQWWLWANDSFHPQYDHPTPGDESATALGDLDGDGRGDMVITLEDEVVVFAARQATAFSLSYGRLVHVQSFEILPPHRRMERDAILADFDGDGRDELVLAFGDEVRLYRGDATAVLRLQSTEPVVAGQPTDRAPSLEVGDFDDDPGLELAVFHPDLERVSVFSPDGHSLGAPTMTRTMLGGPATQIAAGDIDGDGDDDLVVFQEEIGPAPPHFEVLRHGPGGECVPEAPRVGGPASDLVDLDGDGDLDGVCCGGGGGPLHPRNDGPSVFRVCVNDGTGLFTTAATYAGTGAHKLAAALDYDNDGDVDLIAGTGMILNEEFFGTTFCTGHPNSTGSGGELSATGSARGLSQPLTLEATGLPSSTLSVVVYGLSNHPHSTPIGAGELCILPTWIQRGLPGVSDASGARTIDIPGGGASLPFAYNLFPGATLAFQVWHRDLPSHGGSNLTRGVAITFGGE